MKLQDIFDVVYTHTEGTPLCIIANGIHYPTGTTILEKRRYLEENFDWVRKALMREPRGHKDMFGVFVTPPSGPDFDAGLIYIDGQEYSHMCGHGTIALSMAMVSLGMVPRTGNNRQFIRFETTAGPVTAEVSIENGEAKWTRFENVPAYVAAQDIPIELPGLGRLSADIAWGGNYFGIIDLRGTRFKISPENATEISKLGLLACEQLNTKVRLQHPTSRHINNLNFVTFWHEPTIAGAFYKNVHIFSAGALDRSPGGTGTSAMMAMLEARGLLKLNQPLLSEGLIGSGTFEGCLVRETYLGDTRAVVPTVKGTAGLLGTARWVLNRNDPVDAGFMVS